MADGERQLPSGVVTFVVTDIEGSTRLLRALGDGFAAVLERQRVILREAWQRHSGHEVDCHADGSLVCFADVDAALDACADAQRALAAEPWPQPVRVRMGVHTGLAAPRGHRYVAMAVHQVARIGHAAHGGQVVVSEQSAEQAAPGRLLPLGRYRVRDFDRPVQLCQLVVPGGPDTFPAVRCVPAERHNVGVPATRLIGRDHDLRAVAARVAAHRLVTVVGTGGVGKTRLVTELAVSAADRWADGVWLLECGAVDDASLLPQALAAVLGVSADGGCPTAAELSALVRDRRTLIVLDGCERHLEAVGALAQELLRTCPHLQVLVTSTEPLRVVGEGLYRLEPLGTGAGTESDAVALFTDRARAVRPDFHVTGDLAADVVSICRRLDGLPLALEIAAARMTVMSASEVLAGMSRRFRLLRINDRSRPRRQQALDALLDWSFDLLTPAELRALRRTSLFAAPFDLAAAEAAVGSDDPDDVAPEAVPELVWSLVDKSLLVADAAEGRTRYRSLETVRSYAREQLVAEGGLAACAVRLAALYADRLGPRAHRGPSWVAALATDLDNVRSVVAALPPEADAHGQELACAIARYHAAVQSFRVGISEVTRLARRFTAPTPARTGLLTALGDLHVRIGDAEAAARCADEAEELRRRVGRCPWDEVGVDKLRGDVALFRDRPLEAHHRATTALLEPLSPVGRARLNNLLGIACATLGRQDDAAAAFAAELAAAHEADDEVLLAHAHSNSAEIALRGGDQQAAAVHLRSCLSLASQLGQPGMIAYTLIAAARLGTDVRSAAADDWARAVRLVAHAERLLRESGLALYDTDSRLTEEFLLAAREHLGPARYAEETSGGRELPTDESITVARRVLDAVTRRPDRPPVPRRPEQEVRS